MSDRRIYVGGALGWLVAIIVARLLHADFGAAVVIGAICAALAIALVWAVSHG